LWLDHVFPASQSDAFGRPEADSAVLLNPVESDAKTNERLRRRRCLEGIRRLLLDGRRRRDSP
jgi:hypothetical protein